MIVKMPSSSNVRLTRERDAVWCQLSSVNQQVLLREFVEMFPDNSVAWCPPNSVVIFLDKTVLRS